MDKKQAIIKKSPDRCRLLFSLVLAFLIFPKSVSAISVSPVILDIEIPHGQKITKLVRIYNDQETPILIAPELAGFSQDINGNTQITRLEYNNPLKNWLSYNPDTLKLNSGAWIDWQFEINVPFEAEFKTYNLALLFASVPENYNEDFDRPVSIVSKTGPLIFLTVSGGPAGKGEITELIAGGKSLFGLSFFDHLPKEFMVRIKNISETAILPKGHLVVINMLGRIKNAFTVNADERLVLPGWVRGFNLADSVISGAGGFKKEWQNFGFGPYKTALTMELGGDIVQKEYKFWVVPWRSFSLAMLLLSSVIAVRRGRNKGGAL